MSVIDQLHRVSGELVRPLTFVRGAGRVCMALNWGALMLGAAPVKTARMRDGTSILVDLRSKTEWYSWYTGRYDELPLYVCRELLRVVGGNFLDVGGNIGMYAVRIARTSPGSCKVYVAEPVPANQQRIILNMKRNQVSRKVFLLPVALSNAEGEIAITLREDFERGSSTGNASIAISNEADGAFKKIYVPMARYDEVRRSHEISHVYVMKIDIEGHEDLFFEGARTWIAEESPFIVTEVNKWYYQKRGTTIADALKRSLPAEYVPFAMQQRGSQVEFSIINDLNGTQGMQNILLATEARLADVVRRNSNFSLK